MLGFLWQTSAGYRLTPWRSPYLRWRMETYWGVHAEEISFTGFWTFLWRHKRDLGRFLHWADRMRSRTAARLE